MFIHSIIVNCYEFPHSTPFLLLIGTVGLKLPDTDVRIIDPSTEADVPDGSDGEIIVSGQNVMKGYHNNQKANAEVFLYKDGKRYFRTGDQGRWIDGKFLKITGRIKEQYKLENGKYVVPTIVEDAINRSLFVAQSLVYGDNKPYNIVLIVPEFNDLQKWLYMKDPAVGLLPVSTLEEKRILISHPFVVQLLSDEIVSTSVCLKGYEKPRAWAALLDPFSQENQLLTPKMSIRRGNAIKMYSDLVNDIYSGKQGIALTRQPISKEETP
jgi:long-chain acyl-CoA synthetase